MAQRLLRFVLVLIFLISPIINFSNTNIAFGMPSTGIMWNAATETKPIGSLPTLKTFISSLKGGSKNLSGVFVPGLFAYQITQQPASDAGFVSAQPDLLTQFRMASQYNTIGLLAHDYLAGSAFMQMKVGQDIVLIFGNGELKYYQIYEIQQFQALTPSSPYSSFIDLSTLKSLSAEQLFYQTYGLGGRLIFQTCISKNNISSWGRLFILAKPVNQPSLLFENVAPIIPAILESIAQALAHS